jgi:hypothetical protein
MISSRDRGRERSRCGSGPERSRTSRTCESPSSVASALCLRDGARAPYSSPGRLPHLADRTGRRRRGGSGGRGRHIQGRRWRRPCRWRRRCRRRVGRLGTSGNRHLIPLRVHALHICDVVAPLHREARAIRIARSYRRPAEEPRAGADGRTGGRTSRGSADGGTEPSAHGRTDGGPRHGAGGACRVGSGAGLLQRPLPTHGVISLELLEVLHGTRQHEHARSRRHRGAACQEKAGREWQTYPPRPH